MSPTPPPLAAMISAIRSIAGRKVESATTPVLRSAFSSAIPSGSRTRAISPARMAEEMARVRDPEGIAELKALRKTGVVADSTFLPAIERIALIMAAKGGGVGDITPGDCLELLKHCREVFTGGGQANRHSPFFYQLLHTAGVFPA